MEQTTKAAKYRVYGSPVTMPMLIGAVAGLGIALFFIVGSGRGDPEWPKFWMLRPLVIVPLAGATGGMCYHFINRFFYLRTWPKALAVVLSLVVCFIGLWMGIILGFVGTMWH